MFHKLQLLNYSQPATLFITQCTSLKNEIYKEWYSEHRRKRSEHCRKHSEHCRKCSDDNEIGVVSHIIYHVLVRQLQICHKVCEGSLVRYLYLLAFTIFFPPGCDTSTTLQIGESSGTLTSINVTPNSGSQ